MQEIIEASIFSLGQLKHFLQQLNQQEYTAPLPVFSGSTLGMHTRHIIEFYQCLLQPHDANVVNYDLRKRDLQLEVDLEFCCSSIDSVLMHLKEINQNSSLVLTSEIGYGHTLTKVDSGLDRELIYLLEHTIHHMAILKMGCVVSLPHIPFDEHFGLAYSTIKFNQRVHRNLLTHPE